MTLLDRHPLSPGTSEARLLMSHRGFLVCSRSRAIPIELAQVDGQLVVDVADAELCEQLQGQIVAVSVGQHAFRYCRGWTVVAQGRLGARQGQGLPLSVSLVDGATFS